VAASAAALPAATSPTTFSFAQWVEDIIAHPDTALTVDEAVAAAHAASVVGSAGGLQKRAPYCDGPSPRAPVRTYLVSFALIHVPFCIHGLDANVFMLFVSRGEMLRPVLTILPASAAMATSAAFQQAVRSTSNGLMVGSCYRLMANIVKQSPAFRCALSVARRSSGLSQITLRTL
jgi:hypothetical protein